MTKHAHFDKLLLAGIDGGHHYKKSDKLSFESKQEFSDNKHKC